MIKMKNWNKYLTTVVVILLLSLSSFPFSDIGESKENISTQDDWSCFGHDNSRRGRTEADSSDVSLVKDWAVSTEGGLIGSPTVGSDGTIYQPAGDTIYAFEPDGTKKWEFSVGDNIASSPAVDGNGTVYFGSKDNYFYSLSEEGERQWKFETEGLVDSSPVIDDKGRLYFGSNDGVFYSLYPNGTERWNYTTYGLQIFRSSPAIGPNGIIYTGSLPQQSGENGYLYAFKPDGKVKWIFPNTDIGIVSTPTVSKKGTIYFGTIGFGNLYGNLYAVNSNGTEIWNFTTNNSIASSPAIASDGTVYVGSYDNNLYAFHPNGTKKWNFTTEDSIFSSPSIDGDGTIYIGSLDNHTYAVNSDGTQRWARKADSEIFASAAIGGDGSVYIGSFNGTLYAYRPKSHPYKLELWSVVSISAAILLVSVVIIKKRGEESPEKR